MKNCKQMPFLKIITPAFPWSCRELAEGASGNLAPFVDRNYPIKKSSIPIFVLGREIIIPRRIHFLGIDVDRIQVKTECESITQCVYTRSTDGYMRQKALRHILRVNEPWSVPFVVLLSGEYVVEISEDLVSSLPTLNRDTYVNFVRENRPAMRLLRAMATSYWNCYYRYAYPIRSTYPGLAFLNQLELWAS